MPRITRTFIKAGLIWFLLALLAGLIAAFGRSGAPVLFPLFWHMLTVGWITQIIMGVSIWMFPGRTREDGFRAQRKPWLAFLCLNGGLVLRVFFEPLSSIGIGGPVSLALPVSALLHLTGAGFYVMEIWPRVQSKEMLRRLRRRERAEQGDRG